MSQINIGWSTKKFIKSEIYKDPTYDRDVGKGREQDAEALPTET